jgi:hypothetical protein
MSRIKIMPDSKDLSKPAHVPKNIELSTEQPRYKNTGKPPLALDKSYSPQAKKQREN